MSGHIAPSLQITLFGYPAIQHDGSPLGIRRRKALALLAYLAASGTEHSRDSLATLLWPETESGQAFAFLRNALWILNKTPVADWLSVTRHTIGLRHADTLEVDALSFRRLCAALSHETDIPLSSKELASLTRAVSLYRHPFLHGFSIDDSPTFDDWVFSEGEALRQEYTRAARTLASHHEALQQYSEALDFARRITEAQPLNEEAHRLVMRLSALRGDRSAALAQYAACQGVLEAELGLSASEATSQLADSIRRGEIKTPVRPALSPSDTTRSLPTYVTSFVGRNDEYEAAVRLLRRSDTRIITVTGPGGCGKTRFAVEVARRYAVEFPGIVAFVPLAQVASPQFVPFAIADALDAPSGEAQRAHPGSGGDSAFPFSEQLLRYLARRPMLLLLDNAEHLASCLHWMPTILQRIPDLKLLFTSRHQLQIPEERLLGLDGLGFPEADASEGTSEYPAVSLFLQIALHAVPSFSPTRDDISAIARITRAVEGIPLGIELAAAWVRSLSCADIAEEVERNLDFLSTESPYTEKRHRSLRATFIHSWSLLPRDTRDAFRRLSVFPASYTQHAAADVLHVSLSQTATLVSRSLLRRLDSGRYVMPEVIKEYVAERLAALPRERDQLLDRFAGYFLAYLADEESALKGPQQKEAMQRIHTELPNIRAAWHHASERHDIASLSQAAMSLFIYYDMGGHLAEAREILRSSTMALRFATAPEERKMYAYSLGFHAWFNRYQNPGEAEADIQEALHLLQESTVSREYAFLTLLDSFMRQSTLPNIQERVRKAAAFLEDGGSAWELAVAREVQAYIAYETDPSSPRSLELAEESARLRTTLGDLWGQSMAHFALGTLCQRMEKFDRARSAIERSLELRRALGHDSMGAIGCLLRLGEIAQSIDDHDTARTYYQETLRDAENVQFPLLAASARLHLAELAAQHGHPNDAAQHAAAALSIYRDFAMFDEAARCETYLHSAS